MTVIKRTVVRDRGPGNHRKQLEERSVAELHTPQELCPVGPLQLPQPRATGKVRATVSPTLPHTCSCQLLSGSHHLIPAAMGKWRLREFLSLVGVTQQRGRAGILAGPG